MSLSYSGAGVLEDCERKYCHQYLAKTPIDVDFVKQDYFSFGQCCHKVLELLNHKAKSFKDLDFKKFVESFNLDYLEDGGKIAAILRNYWYLHAKSNLDVIANEIRFEFDHVNGIIDAIAIDNTEKGFWIIDYKTTGMLDATLPARVTRDEQLTLYAGTEAWLRSKFPQIANLPFLGVRLRESFKPKIKPKKNETYAEYTIRCEDSCKTRETIVRADKLDIKGVYENFAEKSKLAKDLQKQFQDRQSFVGRQNFKACTKFGSPCQFWSQCYGQLYSESIISSVVNENSASFSTEQVDMFNDIKETLEAVEQVKETLEVFEQVKEVMQENDIFNF